jgi:hypothetical protein
MSKSYSNITLLIAYADRAFYDLELQKPNSKDAKEAYTINLEIQPQTGDTLLIDGLIQPQKSDMMHFQSHMMKMYPRFVVTYNYKLPPPPPDSTSIKGHDASKTITVLKHA